MKQFRKIILILILLMGAFVPLQAQIQWEVDTTHIRLGEQIQLSIRGAAPTLDELSQNDLIAVEQSYDTSAALQRTMLTCFEEGEHWLKIGDDSLLIIVDDVADVDTASADIKDIASIEKEPLTVFDILRWCWIPLLIALLVWGLLWWHRKQNLKGANEEKQPEVPLLPSDQQALLDLETLRQKQLWQQGKVKEYHTELTDIVRLYLERAHGIPSAEMTSDQTMEAYISLLLKGANDNRERLRRILQTADMVKFAKSEPLPYEHDRSLNDAIEFVKADKLMQTSAEVSSKTTDAVNFSSSTTTSTSVKSATGTTTEKEVRNA